MLAHRARTDPFERLHRRHVADVYRYALAVLANPAGGGRHTDGVPECTRISAGTRPERPGNWLIVIAQNAVDSVARPRRPGVVSLDDDNDDWSGRSRPHTLDDADRASRLAFNQRTALVMREVRLLYAEIAQALDLRRGRRDLVAFRPVVRSACSSRTRSRAAKPSIRSRASSTGGSTTGTGGCRAHLRACPDCASAGAPPACAACVAEVRCRVAPPSLALLQQQCRRGRRRRRDEGRRGHGAATF